MDWSNEQVVIREVFRNGKPGKHGVVRARAGTGKTTTIKGAFEVAPERQMLYAVFNKRNQEEAAAKITDSRVNVATWHSVGYRAIRRVWSKVKPDNNVDYDRIRALAGDDVDRELANTVKKLVAFGKNLLLEPTVEELMDIAEQRLLAFGEYDDEDGKSGPGLQTIAELALAVMELSKTKDDQDRISFDDMVWLPVVMGWIQPQYDLICVDEAQDMNLPQLTMAQRAIKANGRIFIVGDDCQAIYGFRGAASDGIDMMKRTLNADEFGLTVTYRCPKSVVRLAQEYVPDYKAHDSAPEGEVIDIAFKDMVEQAKPGDAILSRLNAPLVPICLSFLKRGIRARIQGKDVAKALEAIVKRVKARSVPEFLIKLEAWRKRMVNRFINKDGERSESQIGLINDQAGMLHSLAEDAANVSEISNRLNLLFVDIGDSNSVTLSSVHKAKGLEWNRVFTLTPTFLKRNCKEERNIYYVAITRAKQSLFRVAGA